MAIHRLSLSPIRSLTAVHSEHRLGLTDPSTTVCRRAQKRYTGTRTQFGEGSQYVPHCPLPSFFCTSALFLVMLPLSDSSSLISPSSGDDSRSRRSSRVYFPAGSLTMNRNKSRILVARVFGRSNMDDARAGALIKYFGFSLGDHWDILVFHTMIAWEDVKTREGIFGLLQKPGMGRLFLGGDLIGGEIISAVDGSMNEELRQEVALEKFAGRRKERKRDIRRKSMSFFALQMDEII